MADNESTDGSDELASALCQKSRQARFVPLGGNHGFCRGNNLAANEAEGQWLLFANNDLWFEPDCLERLISRVEEAKAEAACPLILNYGDESVQSGGAAGIDIFGLPTLRDAPAENVQEVLMPEGCAYLIRSKLFHRLGGFDESFFMYSDEFDLSLRVWLAGERAVVVKGARVHHWGGAQVNAEGTLKPVTVRTSETKRYYANRNALMALLKNGQFVLLLMALFQAILLLFEGVVGLCLVRRWSFVKKAYIQVFIDVPRPSRRLPEINRGGTDRGRCLIGCFEVSISGVE